MPRGEAIERPEVPLDALQAGTLGSADATKAAPGRDRSDTQRTVDDTVAKAHGAWDARANGERAFLKLARLGLAATYRVAPEQADTVKAMVLKAGTLHDVTIRFGKPFADEEGRTVIAFVAMDRK